MPPDSALQPPAIRSEEGTFVARDQVRLFWRSEVPADPARIRACVGVVHGYADHSGRWREALARLAAKGFAAHAFDHRGHGRSDGPRGHCTVFGEYLDDLDAFLEHLRFAGRGQKLFLLGHSVGGLVIVLHAATRGSPAEGLVLSAPWMKMAMTPPRLKLLAARLLVRVVPWLPMGNELKAEELTHDLEIQRATRADALYNRTTTPGWFFAATGAQEEALRRASDIQTPSLLMHGTIDPIAEIAGTRELHGRLGSKDKTLKIYDGKLHELLNEVGRDAIWSDLLDWLDARV